MEVLDGSHVAWQEQYILVAMGKKFSLMQDIFIVVHLCKHLEHLKAVIVKHPHMVVERLIVT